jgi:hypothetical protein
VPRLSIRAPALAAGVAALAFGALAGCGKSGPPSKAQYLARADKICANEKQRMNSIALSANTLTEAIDEANQARAQTGAELGKLKKPAASAGINEWLATRSAALALARRLALNKRDKAANNAFLRTTLKAESLAKSLGLTSCKGFAAA